MNCSVECHSGYTYAERPRMVIWQGTRLPVDRIEATWRDPDGKHFRVQTEQGVLELIYYESEDHWELRTPLIPIP